MLYFSYKFFLYSFHSNYLRKYSRIFFFHLLCKFNLVVFDYIYNIICCLFGNNSLFNLYFIKIKHKYFKLNINLLSILSLITTMSFKSFSRSKYINSEFITIYIWLSKSLFLLRNYCVYLLKNFFYVQVLEYLRNYKGNINLLISGLTFRMPVTSKVITILKSPHVHKKARDQYFLNVHKMGFSFTNLVIFYPKIFYLNFLSNVSIKLQRNLHLL